MNYYPNEYSLEEFETIKVRDQLIESGAFEMDVPWILDSVSLTLIGTRFTFYGSSSTWLERPPDGDGHLQCDTEYVIANVSEEIQTVLLFNLELLR